MLPNTPPPDLYQSIRTLLLAARAQVRQTVNTAMVQTYWQIGRVIVENEQGGQKRAAYGKQVLPELAKRLSEEFGAGFDVSNLRNMRLFFQHFPIRDALRLELSWTHYRSLIRIDNPQARDWYAKEAVDQGWSVRALDRQIATLYYERLLSSQDKAKAQLQDEAAQNMAKNAAPDPRDFIRDPYVLEFLGAPAVPALYKKRPGARPFGPVANLFAGAGQRLCVCGAAKAFAGGGRRLLHRLGFLQLPAQVLCTAGLEGGQAGAPRRGANGHVCAGVRRTAPPRGR